jgi:hypothetical protein
MILLCLIQICYYQNKKLPALEQNLLEEKKGTVCNIKISCNCDLKNKNENYAKINFLR